MCTARAYVRFAPESGHVQCKQGLSALGQKRIRAFNASPQKKHGAQSLRCSAGLDGRKVAGSDLALVSGEGCEDFGLLALRNLEMIQGPSELRCDFIEF